MEPAGALDRLARDRVGDVAVRPDDHEPPELVEAADEGGEGGAACLGLAQELESDLRGP